MRRGTIKLFNVCQGFGFIAPSDGSSPVYVHVSAIDAERPDALREGQTVEFEAKRGLKGPQAIRVRPLG